MELTQQTDFPKPAKVRWFHILMPSFLQGVAWPLGRFLVHYFTHLEITGKEHIQEAIREKKRRGTGVVLIINHTHELDFLFPLVGIPPFSNLFPMFYVAHGRKKYTEKTGFGLRRFIYGFPAFLTSWGAHPYIAGQKDYTKSMPFHENLLRAGRSVCIFPEGKLQKEGVVTQARGGAAYLAEATNSILLPVMISGAKGMSFHDFLKRNRHITVSYGKPLAIKDVIDTSFPIPERYQKAAQHIIDTMYTDIEANTHSSHTS